jgi:hypothetical protein
MVAAYALTPFVAFAFAYIAEMTLWRRAGTFVSGTTVTMGTGGSGPSEIALALAMTAGLVAVFVTVFGVIPMVAWLMGRGQLSLRTLVLLGAALGNAPFALLCLFIFVSHVAQGRLPDNPGDLWYGPSGAFRTVTEGLFVGMGCAAVFWAVCIRGSDVSIPRGRPRR